MSHFSLTVKLSAERLARHGGDVNAALDEILAPYQEGTSDARYLEFFDVEDECRARYARESIVYIRMPNGDLVSPYDNRPKLGETTHLPHVEVPATTLYATFEEYMEEYHAYERDEKTGRFGDWCNKNAKWDWFEVGGRWTGSYPLKSGAKAALGGPGAFDNKASADHGDVVRVRDIDFDQVATRTRERANAFFTAYMAWLNRPTDAFQTFDGPRSLGLELGLVRVVQGPAEAGPDEVAIPLASKALPVADERQSWTDIAVRIDVHGRDAFVRKYGACFNPIVTYAALDDIGWHASGEMGWFGCKSDRPDDYVTFHSEFLDKFIKTALEDDTLVIVDCHT